LDSALLVGTDRGNQPAPAIALHFIDFEERGTKVVLKCNTCNDGQNFFSWRISRRLSDIAQELRGSILSNIDVSSQLGDPTWLDRAGKAIFGLLFFGDDSDESAAAVKKIVQVAISANKGTVPALFVRSISRGADPFFLLPIGLTKLDMGNGQFDHIGYHFR